jgi:shikimate dehydrogenase
MKPTEPALTRPLGLFGNPVDHSFSPLFMNYALSLLNLNYHYLAFAIEERNVETAVHALRILGFRGANVTIPFKQSVLHHLDHVDGLAKKVGAVNCIVNDECTLTGYNTDHTGFIKPLINRGISINGRRALIIGAGGAARAVLTGLVDHDISHLLLLNRTEQNARSLIDWCTGELHFTHIDYGGPPSSLDNKWLHSFDLIINTTPVGMHPGTGNVPLADGLAFTKHQTVYDLIYNPWETKLLNRARTQGATVLNGFEMLIVQGLYSLTHWFPQREEEIVSLQKRIVEYTKQTITGD